MKFQKGDLVVIKDRHRCSEYYKNLVGIYLSSVKYHDGKLGCVLWFSDSDGAYKAYPSHSNLEKLEG